MNCVSQFSCQDTTGYVRQYRGSVATGVTSLASDVRWRTFLAPWRLEERCKLGQGDIEVPGGIQGAGCAPPDHNCRQILVKTLT
eukprot:1515284-Pyramimonas_sp.AAC.1